MSGFAQQAETLIPGFSHRVMAAFRPSAIPVTAALATQFAVFDRWFSSIPGPTQPNRFFLHSGLFFIRKRCTEAWWCTGALALWAMFHSRRVGPARAPERVQQYSKGLWRTNIQP